MNPGTRARLEWLFENYSRARRRTLRMLVGISKEDLDWQPAPSLPSARDLLRNLAHREHRLLPARARTEDTDPRHQLSALGRCTGRFVRRLLDGLDAPKSARMLRDLEDLTGRELAVAGQVDLLRRLRAALSVPTARPIPPGRAGQAVPERKSLARKANA